jgi:hypothetical protein
VPGEHIPCGNGMSEGVRTALSGVLHTIIPSMFKAQEPWALMGSTASVLQGIDNYTPPDIDIVTTTEGAYILSGAVSHAGTMLRPVSYSETERYASHFGVFEVDRVKVEVMGDLVIKVPDGRITAGEHFARWSEKVRILHFESMHVPVIPLEWQLVANVLLERPERSLGIAHFLLDHDFDRPYLDALLMDEHLGARTIDIVRDVMCLD